MKYRSIYFKDGKLRVLDQTILPNSIEYIECKSQFDVFNAIEDMKVRGAPAIGIAAAYGLALSSNTLIKPNGFDPCNWDEAIAELTATADFLNTARPTAVNLKWATSTMLEYVKKIASTEEFDLKKLPDLLLAKADEILSLDAKSCKSIGICGSRLIKDGMTVLTHCNAGALATAEWGTALSPLYVAHNKGVKFKVYANETRPWLQGSRLTTWELKQAGIDVTLVVDSCDGYLMSNNKVDLVIVGADRIARNGDVANKIGTLGIAVLCKYFGVPFYVAAPFSTFDQSINYGKSINIEIRNGIEVTHVGDKQITANDVRGYNPAFDVTPGSLINGIITESGIIAPSEIEKYLNDYNLTRVI